MSRYQRFVAYVYEYQRQKKGKNRGFVRVENKEGVCSFHIQLQSPGLIGQMPCRVYGFLREKDQINGVFLGEGKTKRDGFQWEIEVRDGQMGKSQRKLEEFGGMVFLTEGGGFYGTEWDDGGIIPEQFREEEKKEPEKKPEEHMTGRGEEESIKSLIEEEDGETENSSQEKAVISEEITDDIIRKKIPEPDDWEKDEEDGGKLQEKEENEQVLAADIVAEEETREKFEPFQDGEIVDCMKIDLQEISFLNRRDWALRNNRFLLYGYYHFGYLFIGRMRGRQQYVLGVPGMYDQQERFMANMFGFTHFKLSPLVELPDGKGGYWYRLINPPNFHERNR